jgi:tetratricopeptide (TPR) repeat protein
MSKRYKQRNPLSQTGNSPIQAISHAAHTTHHASHLPRLSKALIFTQVLINLIVILGFVGAGYVWLNNTVYTIIDSKLRVFNDIGTGLLEAQAGHHDQAIAAYDMAYGALKNLAATDATARALTHQICGGYLYVLGHCPEPRKYLSTFNRVMKLYEDGAVNLADRDFLHLGWFHFNSGNASGARAAFDEALTIFTESKDELGAADAQWGLCRVELAEGHADAAYSRWNAASDANPDVYGKIVVDHDDADNRRYALLYRDQYLKTLDDFSRKAEKELAPMMTPTLRGRTSAKKSP